MITISIIIPTLNRASTLKKTLRSILQQKGISNVEVIVIDNGSTDETELVCENFSVEKTLSFHYRKDEEPGLLTGRHLGASLAKGDVLCFLDDDVELDLEWLANVREAFQDPSVQLATGPSIPNYEVDPPDWLPYFWTKVDVGQYCQWLSLLDLGNREIITHPNYVWGLNFCIRKSALQALDGFNPDTIPTPYQMFQGDGETGLTIKAYQNKFRCLYHPGVKLHHLVSKERLTIEYFKKRAFFQGICDSYTKLRQIHLASSANKTHLWEGLKNTLRFIKRKILSTPEEKLPKEIKELKEILQIEERKGYQFHQDSYYSNEKVRQWVHQKNYWDYKLPR